jgi:hypothetical protein
MKVTNVVSKLDNFGSAEAESIDSGDLIFHIRGNLDSISEIENLIEYVDNIPTARIKITGDRKDALIIINIKCDKFDQIPPYLME